MGINPKAGAGMKEIVIISGKGGTGKTSTAASFAALAQGKAVVADCDVDAADLHLILTPQILQRTEFRSGRKAEIRTQDCSACGTCVDLCRFDAVRCELPVETALHPTYSIDPVSCEGCGVCVRFCPVQAIDFPEDVCGEWFVSQTRFGTMVHARLHDGAENSGKLVTLIRNEAKSIAQKTGAEYMIIDGSPGIGCPVIASLTAADLALIVTEPTVSGDHDLRRIAELTTKLGIPAMVCVNKWDINPYATEQIKKFAELKELAFAGLVRYDSQVTAAQQQAMAVCEFADGGSADDIGRVWDAVVRKAQ